MNLTFDPLEANAFTHGGIFHCDEVFATAILDQAIPNLVVYRYTAREDYPSDAIVYDIGGGKYDHHQRDGNGVRPNGVPYSSAGLIWRDFGMRLVQEAPDSQAVFDIIDHDLIQGIDAADNGVMPRVVYPTHGYGLENVIGHFNPTWDSCCGDAREQACMSNAAFMRACDMAKVILNNAIEMAVSRVKARGLVDDAIRRCQGPILVLEQFVPWQYQLLNSRESNARHIRFVVFPATHVRGGYNWQCVPRASGSRLHRKEVPESWKGLEGAALRDVSGIRTATFCHKAGFIGGAETLPDTIAMADLASRL